MTHDGTHETYKAYKANSGTPSGYWRFEQTVEMTAITIHGHTYTNVRLKTVRWSPRLAGTDTKYDQYLAGENYDLGEVPSPMSYFSDIPTRDLPRFWRGIRLNLDRDEYFGTDEQFKRQVKKETGCRYEDIPTIDSWDDAKNPGIGPGTILCQNDRWWCATNDYPDRETEFGGPKWDAKPRNFVIVRK